MEKESKQSFAIRRLRRECTTFRNRLFRRPKYTYFTDDKIQYSIDGGKSWKDIPIEYDYVDFKEEGR